MFACTVNSTSGGSVSHKFKQMSSCSPGNALEVVCRASVGVIQSGNSERLGAPVAVCPQFSQC